MSKKQTQIQKGLTDSSFKLTFWLIVIGIIMALGATLYVFGGFAAVDVNEKLSTNGGDVFLKYLFIVVAVERAAAVFVGISRSQNKVDWSLRINRINEMLQKENPHVSILKQIYNREHRLVGELERADIIGKIDDVPEENATDEDYLGYLTSAKHAYEFQKARFDSVANRYVSRIVFFAGIILATIGLSIFQDVFEATKVVSGFQIWLLKFADILVTGGLLGGGSAGLNAIASKFTDFMNKS